MDTLQSELESVAQLIFSRLEYFKPDYLTDTYRSFGLEVIPDALSADIVVPIKQALLTGKPLSVVRIGDGEANIISFGAYPDTPSLNRYAVERIVAIQHDTFKVDPLWMIVLQELMMGALIQADVVGVIGLWNAGRPNPENFDQLLFKDPRGVSGHWRAIDFMLRLAEKGVLKNKTLASAHLYFSLLENLHEILSCTKKVFLFTNRDGVVEILKQRHEDISFEYIRVGSRAEKSSCDRPDFLASIYSLLPADMSGTLSLIGAGPWAEIYCAWIKQRGGVAVDMGSGFDLLAGQSTRPIHRIFSLGALQKYAL